jgi:hypothetical protein
MKHVAVADSSPLEAISNQEYENWIPTALTIVGHLLSSDFPHLNKTFRTSKLAAIFWDHQLKWIWDAWTRSFSAHREEVKEDYLNLCIGTPCSCQTTVCCPLPVAAFNSSGLQQHILSKYKDLMTDRAWRKKKKKLQEINYLAIL